MSKWVHMLIRVKLPSRIQIELMIGQVFHKDMTILKGFIFAHNGL